MEGVMSLRPENTKFVYGKLEVIKNPHEDGESTAKQIEFVFNPSKLTMNAAAKWEQPSQGGNKKASAPTYKGPEPRSMDVEFTLDGWDRSGASRSNERKVADDLATLVSWTRPTKSTRDTKKPAPPTVRLSWGTAWFPAYVATVNSTITMFDTDGKPLRATVKVSLKEMPADDKKQNPTSGSLVGHQSHILVSPTATTRSRRTGGALPPRTASTTPRGCVRARASSCRRSPTWPRVHDDAHR
jgi:hypothetical protein